MSPEQLADNFIKEWWGLLPSVLVAEQFKERLVAIIKEDRRTVIKSAITCISNSKKMLEGHYAQFKEIEPVTYHLGKVRIEAISDLLDNFNRTKQTFVDT